MFNNFFSEYNEMFLLCGWNHYRNEGYYDIVSHYDTGVEQIRSGYLSLLSAVFVLLLI